MTSVSTTPPSTRTTAAMPFAVYILGLTVFCLTTSEFMVAGMMPSLAAAFGVPVERIGYLVSIYAAGMVLGGPVLTVALARVPLRPALLGLLATYMAGQIGCAMADDYLVMAIGRAVTGIAASACFGIVLSMCAEMVAPEVRGRAAAIVIGGLMIATVAGLPLATLVDLHLGWRASFWLLVVLTGLCVLAVRWKIPATLTTSTNGMRSELASLANRELWAAYTTSALIIGATFAGFSYFALVLTKVSGFSPSSIPALLGLYGLATVIGNAMIGRFADRHTMRILLWGLVVLAGALALFAVYADQPMVAVIAMLLVGLTGVSLNPAMVVRVMRAAPPGPLVNTMHTAVINIGLMSGSWLGGVGISQGWGLRSPLWVGTVLAVAGVLAVLPYALRRSRASGAGFQAECAKG